MSHFKNEFSDFSKDSDLGRYVSKNKRIYTGKDAVIIFDPLGVHRGGRVSEGERVAVQLVFCPNSSWKTG